VAIYRNDIVILKMFVTTNCYLYLGRAIV